MMRVLVTGGAGFIGSHLVDALSAKRHSVVVFDNLEPQVHPGRKLPAYFNRKARFVRGDIRSKAALLRAMRGVKVVFHLAAAVGIGQSMYQIKKYVDVNIGGTANILDSLVNGKHQVKKLIIASSATGYGECAYRCKNCGVVYPPLRDESQVKKGQWEPVCPKCQGKVTPVGIEENKPPDCRLVYALTKKWQEELALSVGRVYKIPVVVLRLFNVYGPRQSLFNPYTGVISVFSARLKAGRPPLIIEDGLQTRDFVFVKDVVSAFILAMEKKEANFEIFNVGTGKSTSIRRLAQILTRLYGLKAKPKINFVFRKGDVRHSLANISKIRSQLGWQPRVLLQEGLEEVFLWARNRPSGDKFEKALQELSEKKII